MNTFKDLRRSIVNDQTALSPAIDISRSEAEGINVCGADISGIVCRQTNFRMASFKEITANNGRFLMSDLSGVIFDKCQLEKTDFRGIMGKGIIFYECNMKSANFEAAFLDGAVFCRCDLSSADFKRSYLRNANVRENDLSYADFYLSDLRDVYFCASNSMRHTMGLWSDLEILKTVRGTITGYRLQAKNKSPFHGVIYSSERKYEVDFISKNERIGCAEGLHVTATIDWAISAGLEDFGETDGIPNFDIFECEIVMPTDLVAPIDKGRFRVKQFTLGRKLDLSEWWLSSPTKMNLI